MNWGPKRFTGDAELETLKATRTGHRPCLWFPMCKQHGMYNVAGFTDEPNLVCPKCNLPSEGDLKELIVAGRIKVLPNDPEAVLAKMARGASLGEALHLIVEWVDI